MIIVSLRLQGASAEPAGWRRPASSVSRAAQAHTGKHCVLFGPVCVRSASQFVTSMPFCHSVCPVAWPSSAALPHSLYQACPSATLPVLLPGQAVLHDDASTCGTDSLVSTVHSGIVPFKHKRELEWHLNTKNSVNFQKASACACEDSLAVYAVSYSAVTQAVASPRQSEQWRCLAPLVQCHDLSSATFLSDA